MTHRKKNKHTSLVTLSPIEYRHDDPEDRIATLSSTLEAEAGKPHHDQLLRQCPMLHMARAQIIDNVIPAMGQQPPDSLKSKYLLFVAEVDGGVDDFLDALYNGPQYPFDWEKEAAEKKRHADFVNNTWGQCIGYPDDAGCVFFRQYMARCRIKVTLPFAAYDFTVSEIDRAATIQAKFASFVEANQSAGPDELFKVWQEFAEEYTYFAATGHLAINKKPPRSRRHIPHRRTTRPPLSSSNVSSNVTESSHTDGGQP
jgi:hypothetical protein